MHAPDFLRDPTIRTALETPQVLLGWTLQTDPYWPTGWEQFDLLRQYQRFPQDTTDGVVVLSQPIDPDPAEVYADTVVDPDTYAYYGLFFTHYSRGNCGFNLGQYLDFGRLLETVNNIAYDVVRASVGERSLWLSGVDREGLHRVGELNFDQYAALGYGDEGYPVALQWLDFSAIKRSLEEVRGLAAVTAWGVHPRVGFLYTSERVLVVDLTDTTVTQDDILWEQDHTAHLGAGGSADHVAAMEFAGFVYFMILDKTNQEVTLVIGPIGLSARYSYAALTCAAWVNGIGFDLTGTLNAGNPAVVLQYLNHWIFLDNAAAPWSDDDILGSLHLPHYPDDRSLLIDSQLGGNYVMGYLEGNSKKFYYWEPGAFPLGGVRGAYHHDWYDPYQGVTFGLFHLEELPGAAFAVNSADLAAPVINVGCVPGQPGRFSDPLPYTHSYLTPTGVEFIDATATAPSINGTNGHIEFYYHPIDETFWVAGAGGLFWHLVIGAGQEIYFERDPALDSRVRAVFHNGANTATATYDMPATQGVEWVHFRVQWLVGGLGAGIYIHVNGVMVGFDLIAFAGMAVGTNLYLCGANAGNSAPGYYDEIRCVRGVQFSAGTYDLLEHPTARFHEWSGRDYTAGGFSFRDQIFADMVPEAIRERDARQVHWIPDQILADGEVLHRDANSQDGGQLRALLRMFGLMLDRLVDTRDRVLVDQDPRTVAYSHLHRLSELVGWSDVRKVYDPFTGSELPLQHLRQILQGATPLRKTKGRLSSMHLIAKLYRMALLLEVQYYRRRWDSCVVPARVSIPLDSIRMDTSHLSTPIGRVMVRAYYTPRALYENTNGLTGAIGTSTFDSAGAAWLTDLREGDLLRIQDHVDPAANGDYLITAVPANTQVVVDHVWTAAQGALAGLQHRIFQYIPAADPMAEFVLSLLDRVRPFNLELQYV